MALTDLRIACKQKQPAARLASEYTFMTVYEQWLSYRTLALSEGRQSTLMQIRRKRVRVDDLSPYIEPLSIQAQAIVRQMLSDFKPAQKYLFAGVVRLTDRMRETLSTLR